MIDTDVVEPTQQEIANTLDQSNITKKIQVHTRHIRVLNAEGTPVNATVFGAFALRVSSAVDIYIGMRNSRTRKPISCRFKI